MPAKVDGLILAAGLSTRAKAFKLGLRVEDKTIIERSVEGMYNICSKVIVVVGYRSEIVSDILSKYPRVELVYNEKYIDGMFSSVKVGLKHIEKDRFFFIPGDYPLIKKSTYKEMLAADGDIVLPVYERRKGHPILLKSYVIDEILQSSKYANMREFINSHGFVTVSVDDPGILMDVDTIEDYENIMNHVKTPCPKSG